jgi:methyltransferase (TIGR00027 family)
MKATASQTALLAARHRAVHQLLEGGAIFSDPYALSILGEDAEMIVRAATERPEDRFMRLFVAARSRFAEDQLAAAVERGVRQVVVLGAGLDTFGLRNPYAAKSLQVFEVDHPATQAWKRAQLAKAGLSTPDCLHFAAVDFERQKFLDRLLTTGFRQDISAFFIWLGVVPYLTRASIFETFGSIAAMKDAEVIFDYAEPPESYPPARRAGFEARKARVAALGEPWLSFFEPRDLAIELRLRGFDEIEDFDLGRLAACYFSDVPIETAGGHVVHARLRSDSARAGCSRR